MKAYSKTILAIALAALSVLIGCSKETPDEREAKQLGFFSVEDMRQFHAKGWHTKQRYLEDEAIRQGYKSHAELKAAGEKAKADRERKAAELKEKELKQKAEAEAREKAMAKYGRVDGDIGLECTYSDGSGSLVLIYSDAKSIRRFGDFKNGAWKPDIGLTKRSQDNISINFTVTNEFVNRINPGNGWSGEMELNRESLRIKYATHLRGGITLDNFDVLRCDLMQDDLFKKLVMDIMEARASQQSRNKL